MNRKRESKTKEKVEKKNKLHFSNPYDNPVDWLGADFSTPPWPQDEIDRFQRQLDSAFGGENTIILAWSGDKRYWDEFYVDWHVTGKPKGRPEKKPILLFGEYPVNEYDYVYITCPRWLLLETIHGSQLEAGWESEKFIEDNNLIGGKKQIRTDNPPEKFYHVLKTIAQHEATTVKGEIPPCCERLWQADRRMCFGKYRAPSEQDIAYVRAIRQRQDAAGVVQRNDSARSAKILQDAQTATRHYIKQSEIRRSRAVQELILSDPTAYMVDIFKNTGITMSARELDRTLKEGFEQQEQERFSKE